MVKNIYFNYKINGLTTMPAVMSTCSNLKKASGDTKTLNKLFWEVVKATGGAWFSKLFGAKGNFRLTHYEFGGKLLTIVSGLNDSKLIAMATAFGCPRGFPIVWDPSAKAIVSASGFLPKFANDDEHQKDFGVEHWQKVSHLRFFRKWSGFLTGAVLHEVDGEIRFFPVCKNSAGGDSPYVSTGARLWATVLTKEILRRLWDDGIRSLWGECMAFFDQSHGAPVSREQIIMTAMCREIRPEMDRPNWLTTTELVAYANEIGLESLIDTPIQADGDQARAFLTELSQLRNAMTETKFQELLRKHGLPTNSMHMDVLGDCLEGLVLNLTYEDETTETIKFKFPNYTIRTMLIRSYLEKHPKCGSVREFEGQRRWLPSREFGVAIQSWVTRWVTNPEEYPYWIGRALAIGEECDSME